ncbi:pirin family protein [Flammeovirgaceae bacterium SG7u.111]|nr:pirin family protein [Flammeovirgaceae bacterium SG7u.132]WPO34104.1 pirin family protein [Flammeovirgaceae bacterium SG7u.111]
MDSDKIIQIKPMNFPWETQDPFLFCAHHRDEYPAGNGKMGVDSAHLRGRNVGQDFTIKDGWRMYHGSTIPGFPYHPHRGFETVTINKEGFVDHTDSLGAAGRFGAGDVQWMTAGKGVQHSEMFPLLKEDGGNTLEIFQIWLNLPKASKFVEPSFKMLWKEEVPVLNVKDAQGNTTEINVIAGELNGTQAPAPTPNSWAANPENYVGIFTIKMNPNAQWTLPATGSEANRAVYFYKGNSLKTEGKSLSEYHMAYLKADQDIHLENGEGEGFLLVLQGKPIKEPVAQYGPFVMNTQTEIQEAFADYQRTEFGGWPWPEREQVHGKEKGRFAKHADGREEIKS